MIILAALVFGVLLGVLRARRLGGNHADMVQYGAVFGLIFAVLGMLLTVYIIRQG